MPLSRVNNIATACPSRLDNGCVICAGQTFANHGVRIVPQTRKVIRQFARKILVQLESHFVRIGTSRSSCASSAA